MSPHMYALTDRLAQAGDTLCHAVHLDEISYELGDHQFTMPKGIDLDLVLTHSGEGILLTGMLHTQVHGVCDRCLEAASFSLDVEVDGYYLFQEPEEPRIPEDDDGSFDYFLVTSDKCIDLSEAVQTALVMETPFVVLCQPDCKGLCAQCGANLNEGLCEHHRVQENEPHMGKNNPFSVLKNLNLED